MATHQPVLACGRILASLVSLSRHAACLAYDHDGSKYPPRDEVNITSTSVQVMQPSVEVKSLWLIPVHLDPGPALADCCRLDADSLHQVRVVPSLL